MQKAAELKLDREPRVMQQLEAAGASSWRAPTWKGPARRPSKPTPEDVAKYYDANPALFKERRIYSLQEIAIEAKPEQVAQLRSEAVERPRTSTNSSSYLKANDYPLQRQPGGARGRAVAAGQPEDLCQR